MNMPAFGTAKYNGNWVATVQAADPDGNGDVMLRDGAAMVEANFRSHMIHADLTGLAMLKGSIAGNEFSGTMASGVSDMHGLTSTAAGGEFSGAFSGAFYGDQAMEVGGVFDFMSEDMKAGAFRGAFGGSR